MNGLTKNLLLKFDENNRFETPSDFNFNETKSRVINLKKDLDAVFDTQFSIDDNVQDASFYCDIIIPRELVNHSKSNFLYSIRISNFGSLSTITSGDLYLDGVKPKLIEILEKHNFIYISSEDLDEEYDGNFDKFIEILGGQKPSWWIRYFDYL